MYTTDIGVECTYNGSGTSGYYGEHFAYKALDSSIDTISTIVLISDFRNSVAGGTNNNARLKFALTDTDPYSAISPITNAQTAFNAASPAAF